MEKSIWERSAPWFMTIASAVVICAIGFFLIDNMNWFKTNAIVTGQTYTEIYKIHTFHLFISTLKRLIGFFAAFCLIFIGTGVAIYAMKGKTVIAGENKDYKITLATASPGIIAMVLGVILMCITITSKDSFPDFPSTSSTGVVATSNIQQGTDRIVQMKQ
jgi:hypothetical protein